MAAKLSVFRLAANSRTSWVIFIEQNLGFSLLALAHRGADEGVADLAGRQIEDRHAARHSMI